MTLFWTAKFIFKLFAGVFVVGFGATAVLLWKYQRVLIYPSSFPAGSRTEVATPEEFDLPYTTEWLTTPDGIKLHVYLMLQEKASEKEKNRGESLEKDETVKRRPTVLFLHANAGNMGHRLPIASVFYTRFGCNILMLSYRGYGLSTGSPSETGIRIDAQVALDFIKNHPVLRSTLVVLYGQSIGGAVSIDLASRNRASIHALILENTFLSIPDMIPHVIPPVKPFTFLCTEIWPSIKSIVRIPSTTPVLFLSGRKDELVPPFHMDKLYALCKSDRKVFKSIQDGTHNDTCIKSGYFEAISSFLLSHVVPYASGDPSASQSPAYSSSTDARSAEIFANLSSRGPRRRTRSASSASSSSSHHSLQRPSAAVLESAALAAGYASGSGSSMRPQSPEEDWIEMQAEEDGEESRNRLGSGVGAGSMGPKGVARKAAEDL